MKGVDDEADAGCCFGQNRSGFLTLRHEMQMAAVVVHYSVDVWKSLKKVKKKGIALAQALCANELLEVDHQATMRNRNRNPPAVLAAAATSDALSLCVAQSEACFGRTELQDDKKVRALAGCAATLRSPLCVCARNRRSLMRSSAFLAKYCVRCASGIVQDGCHPR